MAGHEPRRQNLPSAEMLLETIEQRPERGPTDRARRGHEAFDDDEGNCVQRCITIKGEGLCDHYLRRRGEKGEETS